MRDLNVRYLERLSDLYPTIAEASTEVINLEAILNLPKGTEHFLTDIHGEYEAFSHVMKNGSGSVRRKVNEIFGNTLCMEDKQELATLWEESLRLEYPHRVHVDLSNELWHMKNKLLGSYHYND